GLLSRLALFLLVVGFGGAVLAGAAWGLGRSAGVAADAAEADDGGELDLDAFDVRSLVYDRDGAVLATLHAEENRAPVPLETIPDELVRTILAMEDERFYSHPGVDVRGLMRALVTNVGAGAIEQGGSTITQQLVKLTMLTPEQDLDRKWEEAVLAVRLEDQLSKNEILEQYLNTVYFGGGAYGVQAASELYFGKDVTEIGWGESALLASLIRNPNGYDPTRNAERAQERRLVVLDRLLELGLITEAQHEEYDASALPDARQVVLPPPNDYFVEEVKQELLDDTRLGATAQQRFDSVFRGGLRVYTTFDPSAQNQALAARDTVVPENEEGFTSAMVGVEPATGAVRMMVGGPGFDEYQYNLATQGLRQPGSSFKTFVLTTALENGMVADDRISGSGPCRFDNPGGEPDPYVVNNFANSRGGFSSLESQTQRSSNCAFVRLGQAVGLDKVVTQARKMGLTANLDASILSMPLGSIEVSPLEMAAAYASIAADGIYREPYLIERVEDASGNILFQRTSSDRRAMSTQTARTVTDVLAGNVVGGTGTRARLSNGHVAAGKTGTAQDFADAWFVGFTPHLSTAVWMGAPEGRVSMSNVGGIRVTGGSYPATLWGAFNDAYHEPLPVVEFAEPGDTRRGRTVRDESPGWSASSSRRRTSTPAATPTPTTAPPATPPTTAPPAAGATTTTAPPEG
ncbi:MAG: PBP1A family penicillin-binding protein, partial [Actinomycetota bacterium]|nr:PBP1A family penicillin-binding protein [Actinomycetota bacterium]